MLRLLIILPLTASLPQSRQLTAETCEVTDFEEMTRQECEEVKETECQPVKVTKFILINYESLNPEIQGDQVQDGVGEEVQDLHGPEVQRDLH